MRKTIELHVKSYDELKEALWQTMTERDTYLAKIVEAQKILNEFPKQRELKGAMPMESGNYAISIHEPTREEYEEWLERLRFTLCSEQTPMEKKL